MPHLYREPTHVDQAAEGLGVRPRHARRVLQALPQRPLHMPDLQQGESRPLSNVVRNGFLKLEHQLEAISLAARLTPTPPDTMHITSSLAVDG